MKKITLFILLSISQISFAQDYTTELFCQDLNIILQKVQVFSQNIANHQTTRTIEGGPYKKKIVTECRDGHCKIMNDSSAPILKYDPNHPDANSNGYVAYPNFSVQEQMAKLFKAQNAYDIVIAAMPIKPQDLLVGRKFKSCFENYAFFKEQFDFKTYLGR